MKPKFILETWKARDGWRWRIRSTANRKIVAESGEAYVRKFDMRRIVLRVFEAIEWCSIDTNVLFE